MKIQNMFQKDINRDINGVIKVAQDDEKSLHQELSEYIITRELRRHFSTFFDNYSKAIEEPTDRIGVWISGFFGSGKSHFLKILSYLLSNKKVCGKNSIDYFKDKFDDAIMFANVKKCADIQTESILFNIDIEGSINKNKTAVLRVFAKVFYEHCGFYGEDLKIARLEQYIDKKNKTEEFRKVFKETTGSEWIDKRKAYAFIEDDIVKILQSVIGMSEISARNWFNGEENIDMSIKQLVAEIKDYVDSKSKNFRLLFMVDEVGQYIGSDSDLMINLQSIVEELGAKCRGKAWVMVTSQEAIDSVVKIHGDDFSKIQGRFNTRLSLSSSSVDEVIKKRVLAKTEDANQLLRMTYEKENAVLKNIFTFDNPILDIKGYSDGVEFSDTFPFVPYQFIIIQKVLTEIRKHGNSGKHLSGGERSMLSGFQEAAQKFQDRDENYLVPFHQFYDTVHTFLESTIRRVIDRCQKAADNDDGIKQEDVNVLKLLYLIRYIEDIRANINNIAILMVENIHTDKIKLRASISGSLDHLLAQNYIARNGDTYSFLTDEEQDIAKEITNTAVDNADIVKIISEIIFGSIYPSKKFKYKKYDFPYDQYVDNTIFGSASGGIHLRIATVVGDYKNDELKLITESQTNYGAIVRLSDKSQYFDELEQAMKIRKYVKQRNVSQLSESIQKIIQNRQDQASRLMESARSSIDKAIQLAKFYIHGVTNIPLKGSNAKEKLDAALTNLIESVYGKLDMINTFVESDADIRKILDGHEENKGFVGTGADNEYALKEISQWLELQNKNKLNTSMGDIHRKFGAIPYGWKEIDIAAIVARLIAEQKISIRYGGSVVTKDDSKLVDYLRKRIEIDKANVERRIAPSEDLKKKVIDFLHESLDLMDIPIDEDGLNRFIVEAFRKKEAKYTDLIKSEYSHVNYPQKDAVIDANNFVKSILSQGKDNVALINYILNNQDKILDFDENMQEIETFFKSQRKIFDNARDLQNDIKDQKDYFISNKDASSAIDEIITILSMAKPYSRIKDLPELMQIIKIAHSSLLEVKKKEIEIKINESMTEVNEYEKKDISLQYEIAEANDYFKNKLKEVKEANSLTVLDSMIIRINNYKNQALKRIEKTLEEKTIQDNDNNKLKSPKIKKIARNDLCPAKKLKTKEEINKYVEDIRQKLTENMNGNDVIEIN